MVFVKIFAFFALLVIVRAQQNTNLENYYNSQYSSLIRNDEYIEAVRRQNNFHILSYDQQIRSFQEAYLDRINSIVNQQKALVNEVTRVNENLFPLTVLSDLSRECVEKYKHLIPSEAAAYSEMERNLAWGRSQLYYITNPVIGTNRTLNNYYVGTFEKGLSNCHTQYNTTYPVNYTHCLADVVSASNSYTAANQRTFSIQLETAKGTSNVYAKQTHEWCFAVQNSTITNLQRATTFIDQCLHEAEKEGSGCDNKGYYCENVLRLPSYLIDYKNLTMVNPFHGRNNTEKCLTLDIWYGAAKAV